MSNLSTMSLTVSTFHIELARVSSWKKNIQTTVFLRKSLKWQLVSSVDGVKMEKVKKWHFKEIFKRKWEWSFHGWCDYIPMSGVKKVNVILHVKVKVKEVHHWWIINALQIVIVIYNGWGLWKKYILKKNEKFRLRI